MQISESYKLLTVLAYVTVAGESNLIGARADHSSGEVEAVAIVNCDRRTGNSFSSHPEADTLEA
jgi:hypothetical protein